MSAPHSNSSHIRLVPASPVLQTKRLILTLLTPADYPEIAEVGSERDIGDMMISVPQPMTLDVSRDWIATEIQAIQDGRSLTYAVREDHAGGILGVVSLRHIDPNHACAELSFWFSQRARGRGLASEAADALLRCGFLALGLYRIEAYHIVRNVASERLLSRLGFRFEGILRQRVAKRGCREDVKLWSRLRDEEVC